MRKVAVFFGGRSSEREISVLTGVFVLNVLNTERYDVIPLYVHTDGGIYTSAKMFDWKVFKDYKYSAFERVFIEGGVLYAFHPDKKRIKRLKKIDVALNCCHGGLGEGGGVSAICQWNDIPLASPDLTGSGVFMDKDTTKLAARALNIPTVEYIRVNEADYRSRGAFLLKSIRSRLKYPVIIKPAHLGSSIGISVAQDEKQAQKALESAFELDDRVVVEKYLVEKQDVNCAAYMLDGDIVVSPVEKAFDSGVYTFEEKYVKRSADMQKGGGRCALKGEIANKIRGYTRTLYKRMNLKGVVRMDFLISENKAYLCEVNTVPGSLAYYLFCERISDARAFFGDLIEEALRQPPQKKLVTTGILNKVKLSPAK